MGLGVGARIAAFMAAGVSLFSMGAMHPAAVEAVGRNPRALPKRQGRYKLGGRSRSRYWPHQGEREIARRKRQLREGKLQVSPDHFQKDREAA